MKKSFWLSIIMLLAFYAFTIFMSASDVAVKAQHKINNGAIVVIDESPGELKWKDDEKKHLFYLVAIAVVLLFANGPKLLNTNRRKPIKVKLTFLTTVFYQSNYVRFSPALKI
ncbi:MULTISPECIES: hypothetical protein [unclassified Bacillus (in: firmicutes)]|uniref:hypothetical protein n=1 Tax=unclassified Bacillus (in: firmicutes) TaxID=185979 RepID=UPI0008F04102|nr:MULTISPECIES: hypothetical protein [unclassified Bacillus (in: firmicutes)]SFB06300.1 hypothetical protein SAMN02799634_1056 [Bacillus sp. UNCCL13]SFQ87700.1 hypothetical protein SAMN04488577_3112 [Bacillus sp. cl95]